MARKEQLVALVSREVRDRVNILRMAMNTSRGRTIEAALLDGLPRLEAVYLPEIDRVHALASRAGVTTAAYAAAYAYVYRNETYAPSVDDLEDEDTGNDGEVRAYLAGTAS